MHNKSSEKWGMLTGSAVAGKGGVLLKKSWYLLKYGALSVPNVERYHESWRSTCWVIKATYSSFWGSY